MDKDTREERDLKISATDEENQSYHQDDLQARYAAMNGKKGYSPRCSKSDEKPKTPRHR